MSRKSSSSRSSWLKRVNISLLEKSLKALYMPYMKQVFPLPEWPSMPTLASAMIDDTGLSSMKRLDEDHDRGNGAAARSALGNSVRLADGPGPVFDFLGNGGDGTRAPASCPRSG